MCWHASSGSSDPMPTYLTNWDTRDRPRQLCEQASRAKQLATKLSSLPTSDLGELLSSFLRRVVVGEDQIRVMIARRDLCERLRNGEKVISGDVREKRQPVEAGALICLNIEAKLRRYGGVVHVVVPPNPTATPASKTKPSLLKALARAHAWYEQVLAGKALDQRALARQAGFTERYVGKVFSCAFLAPDMVETILEGRQPDDLTFAKLCEKIPLSWTEQRRQFGFRPIASHLLLVQDYKNLADRARQNPIAHCR